MSKEAKQLDCAIDRIKARLIKRAKEHGIWENFGQKEARELMDKYGKNFNYDSDIRRMITYFEQWIINYDGRE